MGFAAGVSGGNDMAAQNAEGGQGLVYYRGASTARRADHGKRLCMPHKVDCIVATWRRVGILCAKICTGAGLVINRAAVIVVFYVGTALATDSSQQESSPVDVVEAASKDGASTRQSEHLITGATFDLSAIKRTSPSRIKGGDLFNPKSWFASLPVPEESSNAQPAKARERGEGHAGNQEKGQMQDGEQRQTQMQGQQQIQGQPAAGVLPYTFIGRMIDGNEVTLFLIKNDRQYVAKVNDVLDNSYRVDKITGVSAVLTYLPTNTEQTLTFGSTAVGSSIFSDSSPNVSAPISRGMQQLPTDPAEK